MTHNLKSAVYYDDTWEECVDCGNTFRKDMIHRIMCVSCMEPLCPECGQKCLDPDNLEYTCYGCRDKEKKTQREKYRKA